MEFEYHDRARAFLEGDIQARKKESGNNDKAMKPIPIAGTIDEPTEESENEIKIVKLECTDPDYCPNPNSGDVHLSDAEGENSGASDASDTEIPIQIDPPDDHGVGGIEQEVDENKNFDTDKSDVGIGEVRIPPQGKMKRSIKGEWSYSPAESKAPGLHKPFKCNICGARVTSKNGLYVHRSTYHREYIRPHQIQPKKRMPDPNKTVRMEAAKPSSKPQRDQDSLQQQKPKKTSPPTVRKKKRNEGIPSIPCTVVGCSRLFTSQWLLMTHTNKYHEKSPLFRCDHCRKSFYCPQSLLQHEYRAHQVNISTNKVFRCRYCKDRFLHRFAWTKHTKLHWETPEPQRCPIPTCQKVFESKLIFLKHLHVEHGQADEYRGPVSGKDPPQLWCKTCGKLFFVESRLNNHEDTHRKTFACDMCDAAFTLDNQLIAHKNVLHNAQLPAYARRKPVASESSQGNVAESIVKRKDNDKGEFYCHICGVKFTRYFGLMKHIRFIHEGKYKFRCDQCGKGMRGYAYLQRHLAASHKIGTYGQFECTMEGCPKKFRNTLYLQEHIARHHNKPEIQCGECGNLFFGQKKLHRHMKLHADKVARPYKCSICNKGFSRKDYLPYHMKTHQGQEPSTGLLESK